jgi:hypothetical protein
MLKRKYLLSAAVTVLACWLAGSHDTVNSGIVDLCQSTLSASPGVVMVCPLGEGDPLTARVGGGSSQITLTVKDNTNTGIPGVPAVDMWLVGCNDGLLLCGGSQGSNADAATTSR